MFYENCPLCGNKKMKKIFTKKWNDNNFYKCFGCSLIFRNPQEDKEKTFKRYSRDYFQYEVENEKNFFSLVKKTVEDFDIFKFLKKGDNILEIGSATGLFLKYMNEKGYNSIGVEICKESAEYGISNYNVDIRTKPLEENSFKDNYFSFIHFSHLIEHLNDPFSFIKEVYRILKKDGIIVVTTPNSSGFFSNYYGDSWRCIVDDHLFLFNKKNLKKLLENNGFNILKIISWGSIPSDKIKGNLSKKIKTISDKIVKSFNIGDVVSILAKK